MKKVLFVATVVKTHINTFHIPYLKMFKEAGYETYVCARNDYDDDECVIPYCDVFVDTPFERSPFSVGNVSAYRKLKTVIDTHDFDIIHCHTPVGGILTRLAARKARKNGAKVVYTAHGFHFFKGASKLNWLLFYPVEKFCARFTDALITINYEDYTLAKAKMPAKSVYYVPGVGVDTGVFGTVSDTAVIQKRAELGLKSGEVMVLSVGELGSNKNHETVIRAIAKNKDSNVRYFIAGRGKLSEHLVNVAKEFDVERQVTLLGYRSDVKELLSACDVFCFPSFREGLSLALMEAMSAGKPVVCSVIRGNTDLITDGEGGFLCDPNSPEQFAEALDKIVGNPELAHRMGAFNRDKVKRFDVESVTKAVWDIYEAL